MFRLFYFRKTKQTYDLDLKSLARDRFVVEAQRLRTEPMDAEVDYEQMLWRFAYRPL